MSIDNALILIETEIDLLESTLIGLHRAAELLRDDVALVDEEQVDEDLVECEDCGEMFHRNGIGPHRRAHRRSERINGSSFDADAARARAVEAI